MSPKEKDGFAVFSISPGSLKKILQFLFLLFAGLHLAGGPYAFVQTFAWGKMLAAYSKESGLLQGARDTFSGERPCELCHRIEAARKKDAENRSEAPTNPSQNAKFTDFIASEPETLCPPLAVAAPSAIFIQPGGPDGRAGSAPPTPPPRFRKEISV